MWTDVYMKATIGEKANSYPRSEFFIKHISISWTNNLINLFIKPCNVKNLHGRDFFLTPQKIFSPKYFTLIFFVQLYHTMILPIHIYIHMHICIYTCTAFKIQTYAFYSNTSITRVNLKLFHLNKVY